MGKRVLLPMMMMLLCVLAFPLAIHADSGLAQYPTDGYVVEEKDDGTVKIVNLKPDKIPNTPYEMKIPEKINGKSVSEISRIGNYCCGGTQLKEVTIPSSVTVIGGSEANSLFQDCTALEKVTLYDTVECFGSQAFMNCHNLQDIVVESTSGKSEQHWPQTFQALPNLHTIDKGAFDDCEKLSTEVLVVPKQVQTLGSQPFDGIELRTMYLMNPDPSKYEPNFLFPNTREDFVAVCVDKAVYDAYVARIQPEEYGNQYTRFLTYEMDVFYDGQEDAPGGIKHSLWNQQLNFKEKDPDNPYSLWEIDKGYQLPAPIPASTSTEKYIWSWNQAQLEEVKPRDVVLKDRAYKNAVTIKITINPSDIHKTYSGKSFPLQATASHPLVDQQTGVVDVEHPKDGDYAFKYQVSKEWTTVLEDSFSASDCAVKNVKDSGNYLLQVSIVQFKDGKWNTLDAYTSSQGFNVTIEKADPIITPTCAGEVPSGTALEDILITPSAGDTPGTVSWQVPSTVVTAGEPNNYDWTYTPADQENYNSPKTGSLPISGVDASGLWKITLHNGTDTQKIFVKQGDSAVLPVLTKAGHVFEQWTTQPDGTGNAYNEAATVTPTKNMDLYAQWKEAYVVTYVPGDGASWNSLPSWITKKADGSYQQVVDKGAYLDSPKPEPEKEGYIVNSWKYKKVLRPNKEFIQEFYFGNEPWSNIVDKDLTLTAEWVKPCTVSFDTDGGTPEPEDQLLKYYGRADKPSDPSKTGYDFLYWQDTATGKPFDFKMNVTKDIALKAIYKLKPNCIVSFNTDGGVPQPMPQSIPYGKHAVEPTNTAKAGFIFEYWMDAQGQPFNFANTPIKQDIILTAKYQPISYTVTFDGNGGEPAQTTATVSHQQTVGKPTDPIRAGYSFDGWYVGESLYDFATPVTADMTLTAHWTANRVPPNPSKPPVPGPENTPEMLNGSDHYAYIVGFDGGYVRPESNCTRAEAATIFFRLLKDEVRTQHLTTTSDFVDVQPTDWFSTEVCTMHALGIIQGRTDTRFDANANITRAEFAALCARFDDSEAQTETSFTDLSGHWAEQEVNRAVALGWLNGYPDGSFKPDAPITRAEVMTLVNKVLCRQPESSEDLLADMIHWRDNDPSAWYYLTVQEATNSHTYHYKQQGSYETWEALQEAPDWSKY